MRHGVDVLCLSHLRWGFVYQRPNHLMARFARGRRVFFVEEPLFEDRRDARMDVHEVLPGLFVCTPHLPSECGPSASESMQHELLAALVRERSIRRPVAWLYTPMALPLVEGLDLAALVYDCMDELSGFLGAPRELIDRERALFALADLVFTGGPSLYESKRTQHPRVSAFPSSVDAAHFASARGRTDEPEDQREIPHPRVGFFGVVDERMDLSLLARVARERPDYHFVIVGPVVKIDPRSLPQAPNLHYLGARPYEALPAYLSGWNVAMMPFALNAATRFISPTKTLEYLAAGRPIVSTAIRDVVAPYGEQGLVHIADEGSFAAALDAALGTDLTAHRARCDALLAQTSWDKTFEAMLEKIERVVDEKSRERAPGSAHAHRDGGEPCTTT